MIASTFGDGQVAYSILWFFLFFIEVWLAVSIFIDIFPQPRSPGVGEGGLGHLRHRPATGRDLGVLHLPRQPDARPPDSGFPSPRRFRAPLDRGPSFYGR